MNWGIIGNKGVLSLLEEIASSDCLGNAYLFYGPDGVGKKLAAIGFAKLLNCKCIDGARCDSCNRIETLSHPDLLLIQDLNKPRWFSRSQIIEKLSGFGINSREDYLETVCRVIEKGLVEEPYPVLDPKIDLDCFAINTDLIFGRGSVPSSECYTPHEISESLRRRYEKGDLSDKEYGLLRLLYELPLSILPYRGRIPVAYVTERSGWRFVRPIRRFLSFTSAEESWKVVIIDDAHKMTEEAQNSLLKTLEEPPGKSVIIMVTSQKEMLFDTIKSRCQQIYFKPLSKPELEEAFDRLVGFRPDEYQALLALCEGSPGNMLNLLASDAIDDLSLVSELFDELSLGRSSSVFKFVKSFLSRSAPNRKRRQVEVNNAFARLALYITEIVKVEMGFGSIFKSSSMVDALERQAARFSQEKLLEAAELIRARSQIAWWNVDLELLLEATLLRVANILAG